MLHILSNYRDSLWFVYYHNSLELSTRIVAVYKNFIISIGCEGARKMPLDFCTKPYYNLLRRSVRNRIYRPDGGAECSKEEPQMDALREKNRRLVAAVTMMDGAYYRWARSTGVTGQTLDLLYALDDGQPHSQKQICEEWLIPKTTVSTVVKACQAAGYLTLEAMPGQGRQRRLCLTPAGRAYAGRTLDRLYAIEDWAMAETVERFGPDFVQAVEFFAARMQTAFAAGGPPGEEEDSV